MDAWQHDKFGGGAGNVNVVRKGGAGDAAGTKLLISNLHPNVTTQDVKARPLRRSAWPEARRGGWGAVRGCQSQAKAML